jgi:transcriptional regulator with XRE-family HTH domain
MAYNKNNNEINVSEMFKPFCETLKQFMNNEGMRYADLSEAMGQSKQYVSYYLCMVDKGKRPSQGFLENTADFFNAGVVYKDGYYYMARLPEGVS